MTYKLKYNGETVSSALTSFFFYMPFTLDSRELSLLQGPSGCHFALLIDGPAKDKQTPLPDFNVGAGKLPVTIVHETHGQIMFDDLELVSATTLCRNAEWAQLIVFRGAAPSVKTNAPRWINANEWKRPPFTPKAKEDNWTCTFDFGERISGAPADETVIEFGDAGAPQRLTLVRRMIKGTICDAVIGVGGLKDHPAQDVPDMKIHTSANGAHDSLADVQILATPNKSARNGYAMMAAGAFAGQNADIMLENWNKIEDSRDLRQRLARIVWAPDNVAQNTSRQLRKLNNAHDDENLGVFGGGELNIAPVEVFFVETSDNDDIV